MLKFANLLSTSTKFAYQYGKAVALNDYSADGTIFDYMSGVRKVCVQSGFALDAPSRVARFILIIK